MQLSPRHRAAGVTLALILSACATPPAPPSAPPPPVVEPAPPVAPPDWALPPPLAPSAPQCLHGCPRSADDTNELIVRRLYALSNNGETKFADWVAYVVREEWIGPQEGRGWANDPDLPDDETLETEDYNAISTLHADRGHQAPLGSFTNAPDWPEMNYLSNITPQNLNLNRGRWRRLEDAERNLARREHIPVFVVTGPLFEREMAPLPNANEFHRVPSGYWKIVATADGRVAAFIFENRQEGGHYCAFARSIDEIETRSGLELFPDAETEPARPLGRAIGC